jgi:hypothetical protein
MARRHVAPVEAGFHVLGSRGAALQLEVLFYQSDEDCAVSYKDKKGKYQGQTGITLPRL